LARPTGHAHGNGAVDGDRDSGHELVDRQQRPFWMSMITSARHMLTFWVPTRVITTNLVKQA
jgi:hypothetical protein